MKDFKIKCIGIIISVVVATILLVAMLQEHFDFREQFTDRDAQNINKASKELKGRKKEYNKGSWGPSWRGKL